MSLPVSSVTLLHDENIGAPYLFVRLELSPVIVMRLLCSDVALRSCTELLLVLYGVAAVMLVGSQLLVIVVAVGLNHLRVMSPSEVPPMSSASVPLPAVEVGSVGSLSNRASVCSK